MFDLKIRVVLEGCDLHKYFRLLNAFRDGAAIVLSCVRHLKLIVEDYFRDFRDRNRNCSSGPSQSGLHGAGGTTDAQFASETSTAWCQRHGAATVAHSSDSPSVAATRAGNSFPLRRIPVHRVERSIRADRPIAGRPMAQSEHGTLGLCSDALRIRHRTPQIQRSVVERPPFVTAAQSGAEKKPIPRLEPRPVRTSAARRPSFVGRSGPSDEK